MPRPTTTPAGNSSHAFWSDLDAAWTFHSTGNTGGADADDIKGSRDATLSGATLSDTLGLESPNSADKASFTAITMADAFSIMWRCKLDAVGNNSMVFGDPSGTANYLWLDSGTNQTEFKKGGGESFSVTDSEKTTLYDYCLVVEAESGSLHTIRLFRKTTAETTWTEMGNASTNNLDSFSLTTVGSGYSGDSLAMTGDVEYLFVFDGIGFTSTQLNASFFRSL